MKKKAAYRFLLKTISRLLYLYSFFASLRWYYPHQVMRV